MEETVTVQVSGGLLKGKIVRSRSGLIYHSFQGIPYAKPPIGALRFQAPQPLVSWEGIMDTLKERNICCQITMRGDFTGSEDCLYLNVYSPQISSDNGSLIAVMVWIHGGGFTMGSGNSNRFGPDYLLEKGVVVVTINFRLGALGFLSTQDAVLPGNLGLRDQLAALQWIKSNISCFNGDPNKITIFGESSGGASVHYLVLSPLAKGLFHQAISQSGTALIPGSFSRFSKERTFRLGEVLGCKTSNSQDLLDFLMEIPSKRLIEAQNLVLTNEEKRRDVLFPFVPCVEPSLPGYNAFLPEEPKDLIIKGSFPSIPFIVGINSHEGIAFINDILQNMKKLEEIEDDFDRMIPLDLKIENNSELASKVALDIKRFYFEDKHLCENNIEQFINLKTDLRYAYAAHQTVNLHSTYGSAAVYYYLFSYNGSLNTVKKSMKAQHLPGATHADELNYIFSRPDCGSRIPEEDHKVLLRMVQMWTDFAKTGNPTPDSTEQMSLFWPPYTRENKAYMCIDADPSVKFGLFDTRMKFWSDLYSKLCD